MGSAEAPTRSDGGFSLIEVLLACVLITIGLLALAAAIDMGFAMVMTAQEDTIAREKSREALESVLTGRNTANITFAQIDNVGTGSGIFLSGFQPLYQAGADGIIGTADDAAAGLETITLPGPDGILGTADDVVQPLGNYQRQIAITDLTATLKQITVTIQYTTPNNLTRSVVTVCYVSPYIN
jgi:hypothetical protein